MKACIGLASGIGAGNDGCAEGPLFLKENLKIKELQWDKIIVPDPNNKNKNDYNALASLNEQLSKESFRLSEKGAFFLSFGGDHSSAIGMWSGVSYEKMKKNQDIGLIWIDAHMDSHTDKTSGSGNIHGMPVAALLGYGDPRLTGILSNLPKIKPENVILIGIRSFEPEEEAFLKKLNVKVYYIDEVLKRGFKVVLEEALEEILKRTDCYGVSFDLDVVDPKFVEATGTKVPNGIHADDAIDAMTVFTSKQLPVAFELVEYNPKLDSELKTLQFTETLLKKLINH